MQGKSSTDYAELSGLKLALFKAQKENTSAAEWIKQRIQELENR